MPTWSNQLPSKEKHMGFDIKRTPQNRPIQAIITCDDLLICDTHFWGGRTIPCERKHEELDGTLSAGDCGACRQSIPFRTHVYISAIDCKTRDHFIFECTAYAAKPLAEYRKATGTLRGCVLHARRPKGLPNSRVVIETNTANLSKMTLAKPPNLKLALTTIWRLPLDGMASKDQRDRDSKIIPQKGPLDRMRNQPDNQPDPPTVGEIISGNNKKKPTVKIA